MAQPPAGQELVKVLIEIRIRNQKIKTILKKQPPEDVEEFINTNQLIDATVVKLLSLEQLNVRSPAHPTRATPPRLPLRHPSAHTCNPPVLVLVLSSAYATLLSSLLRPTLTRTQIAVAAALGLQDVLKNFQAYIQNLDEKGTLRRYLTNSHLRGKVEQFNSQLDNELRVLTLDSKSDPSSRVRSFSKISDDEGQQMWQKEFGNTVRARRTQSSVSSRNIYLVTSLPLTQAPHRTRCA